MKHAASEAAAVAQARKTLELCKSDYPSDYTAVPCCRLPKGTRLHQAALGQLMNRKPVGSEELKDAILRMMVERLLHDGKTFAEAVAIKVEA